MKNRQIFAAFALLLAALFFPPQLVAWQGAKKRTTPKIDLRPSSSTSQIQRIETRLEGTGSVLPEEDSTIRMRLDAQFRYEERVIARSRMLKSIRVYDQAQVRINLGKGSTTNQLDANSRIIIAQAAGPAEPVRLAAIGEPISQTEFELIDTPLNTLTLPQLFAQDGVSEGDEWEPDADLLANILNIDSIKENEVQIKLEKIESGIATIFVGGDAIGTIDGAKTEFAISGTARFDVRRGTVTECRITLNQQRDIGTMAPGLDAVFKIATRITPISGSRQLTDQGLADLRKDAGRITDHFELTHDEQSWSLMHPRQWRVISRQPQTTTLRYMASGQLLGQCDIISLPDRLSNQEQTLDQFKRVVETKLAEHSATITGANESTTESGLQIMRVDALGTSNDIPLKWTYYTISHDDGRRIQLVFTTEPKQARAFAGQDQALLQQIRFVDQASDEVPAQNAGHSR